MQHLSTEPIVSVIIPAFNAEAYIESALHSVQSQSMQDIEIMVINDGSTDDTRSIVEKLALGDPRITVFNQKNTGKPSIARNVGIANAIGKYVAFMDADDIMLPGKLEAQVDVFEKVDDIALVYHDWSYISPSGSVFRTAILNNDNYLDSAGSHLIPYECDTYITGPDFYNYASTHDHGILTIAVMLRRRVLCQQAEWFPEDMDIGEDLDLWSRILMEHRAVFVNRVYSQYRRHSSSITHDEERMILGLIAAGEKNLERGEGRFTKREIKILKRQLASKYRSMGYFYYISKNKKLARKYYINSFCFDRRFRYLLSLVKVSLPFNLS